MTKTVLPCGLTETELRKRVDIERTIAEYGYDPREFTAGSNKKVFGFCHVCLIRKNQKFHRAMEGRTCKGCYRTDTPNDITVNEVYQYLDIERTIAEYGYDPRYIPSKSSKYVFIFCAECGDSRLKKFASIYDSTLCKSCAGSIAQKERSDKKLKNKEAPFLRNKEDLENIDIEETVKKFGYDPRILSDKSHQLVVTICITCKEPRDLVFHYAMQSNNCQKCAHALLRMEKNTQPEEWIKYIDCKKTIKQFGHDPKTLMASSKLPVWVKCVDCGDYSKLSFVNARKKQTGKCRNCLYLSGGPSKGKRRTLTGEALEAVRASNAKRVGKKHPRYGKKAAAIKGFWYNKNNEFIFMRSSWEGKYADMLTEKDKRWSYEPEAFEIKYFYKNEWREGTYTPDFYVDGTLIEIKGYWRGEAREKFIAFKEQYPDKKIVLIMKEEMVSLGLHPTETSDNYLARSPHCSVKKPS